ncbi:MAG: bifunctional demethylmenaquinone methyltransferase/2-methoxy-6-polyprenyl-1,4-benzoquinol methylase UbiE [Alphaproteobacteria bacterium]|nr:bifunctional demethylmenaquinone methyltransferase/2-methoxy-6-polyprenyl-1,4-benzoquinol methylase UbiE [Alphaproteobacteria bacterium]
MSAKNHKNKESQWFGYEKVAPDEKTRRVEGVFDSVAARYDLMNDLMSGGLHRLWKNKFVRMMRPRADRSLLDVAGGTGDIAFRYRALAGDAAKITVCDYNREMLKVGRARAVDRGYLDGFEWVSGDAADLPFEDRRFHLYSISFGLRNVTRIDDALAEARRVLRPGGQFFCLEFSHVKNDLLQKLYDEYSFRVIPQMGEMVADDRESYQYLVESIRQFPKQGELSKRLLNAGFDDVKVTNIMGGIAAIHVANIY